MWSNNRLVAYLLMAKFTNDSNFFVRKVGRGRGRPMLERSPEIADYYTLIVNILSVVQDY